MTYATEMALTWGVLSIITLWITGILCVSYGYKKNLRKSQLDEVLKLLHEINNKLTGSL